jgi:TP901 family phage tail tape measure protein
MANRFDIKITIDGREAESEAKRLRQVIEEQITGAGAIQFDVSGLERLLAAKGSQVAIQGLVQITGLDQAETALRLLQEQAAQRILIQGSVDIQGLTRAQEQMRAMHEDAGALGRSIASGLGRTWVGLEEKLSTLQGQITGLVRVGQASHIAPDLLEGMPELEQALSNQDKRTLDLSLRMQELQARITQLNQSFAELGSVKVQPLGGGGLRTLSEMFKGLEEPYHVEKIRKIVQGIDAELAPLEKVLSQRMDEAAAAARAKAGPLAEAIGQVRTELEAKLAERPGTITALTGAITDEEKAWEAGFAELEQKYMALTQEYDMVRSQAMTGDAEDLKNQMALRRSQLTQPLREEFQFWREWSTGSVEQISADLRASGQSAAAQALQEMQGIFEERKRLQTQFKRAFGGLAKGGEIELPKEAQGTMVDFITAERSLEQVAGQTTGILEGQRTTIQGLVRVMDEAALAASGLGKTERFALAQMEAVGRREIRAETKAGIPLEDAAAQVTEIMARLTVEAQKLHAGITAAMEGEQARQAAEKSGRGIVGVWEWVRERLVGHSIIPEMVQEIQVWLASIGQQDVFSSVASQGEGAADRLVRAFSQIASAFPAEQVATQIRVLQQEISALEGQFMEASVRGSEASERYRLGFEEAADEVRRVLGESAEIEGKLAQGMLPEGFRVGVGESIWQKGEGEARARYGATAAEGDRWYQALKSNIEEIGRQDQAEMDRLANAIVQKQAQVAALQHAQLVQQAEAYERILAQSPPADPGERQALADQLAATYNQIGVSEDALLRAADQVGESVALEAQRQTERIQEEAREFVTGGEGQALLGAAKAEVAERSQVARSQAETIIAEARAATQAQIEEEKRLTAETVAQAKVRVAQKSEAAERATLKARAAREAEVLAAKAAVAAVTEAEKRTTALTKAQIQDQTRLTKEKERALALEGQARQMAAQLGIQWNTYIQKAIEAGVPLQTIVGTLQRIAKEQGAVNTATGRYAASTQGAFGALGRYGRELSRARMESHGLFMVMGDISNVTRTIQYTSAALAGSLTMAARSYLDLSRQTDIASRSLLLNRELTEDMRGAVIDMSSELALIDPQQTAEAVTVWSQATGQQVTSQEELNRLLEQTIPIQQLAVLTQTRAASVTDGTAAALRQYGLRLDETNRVTAIFAKTADDTLATVEDMSQAFKFVGPQAHTMGEEIEDTAAVLGIMANENIRGSQAGRAYRQMLLSLVEPTQKTRDALMQAFGTEQPFYTAEGTFVGLTQVIDMLAAASENATEQQREELLATMFTANAMPAVVALVNQQIEARKKGINIVRAESKLLAGTVDAEVEAYAQLRLETEGVSISMMGAMDLWNKQLGDWEQSDVYRVQQAEMRWKGFWLKIGESALNFAIPYITKGAEILKEVTGIVSAHPELGTLVAVAAGGTIAATLLRTVISGMRLVTSINTMGTALQRTMAAQGTAGTQFQGQVVAAGERFAAIVAGAAQQAAGTEVVGATEETAIEKAGAVEEVAIEKTGAATFAGTAASLLGRALLAYGVGEALSRGLTGQGLAGWFTTAEGEAAGQARAAGLADQTRAEMEAALAQVRADMETVSRYASETTGLVEFYGGQLELLFGQTIKPEDYARMVELMGGRTQTLSATAVTDKLAELRTTEQALEDALVAIDTEATAAEDAAGSTDKLTTALYKLPAALTQVEQLTDEESKAVELYVELLKKQAEETTRFNDALAAALTSMQDDLAKLEADYNERAAKANAQFEAEQSDAERQYRRQRERELADHLVQMRRMEEDHLLRMDDLARARDAMGMLQEQESYGVQRSRAEEDFARRQEQAGADFAESQAERARQHAAEMADMRVQYETQKAERLAQYQEQVEKLAAEHQATMDRLDKEYFDKINAELRYFQQSQLIQAQYQAAMLKDAQVWLASKRRLWLDFVQNLPVPNRTYPVKGRQAGGYIHDTDAYRMHRGEFVLAPGTTRALEQGLGPLTQSRLVEGAMGGGRAVQTTQALHLVQQFEFHGGFSDAERQWFRGVAAEQAKEAFAEVLGGV